MIGTFKVPMYVNEGEVRTIIGEAEVKPCLDSPGVICVSVELSDKVLLSSLPEPRRDPINIYQQKEEK